MSWLESMCHSRRTFAFSDETMIDNGRAIESRCKNSQIGGEESVFPTRRKKSCYSSPTEYSIYQQLLTAVSCFSPSFLNGSLNEFIPLFLVYCPLEEVIEISI